MNCPINGKPCVKYKGFFVTEKHGDKVDSYLVCEDCLYINATAKLDKPPEFEKCSCGMTIEEISRGSRIGCAKCYDHFSEVLNKIIAVVQAPNRPQHVGRIPELWKREQAKQTSAVSIATELTQKLKIAIKEENYKMASELKVKIEELRVLIEKYKKADEGQILAEELANFVYDYRWKEST